MWIKLFQEPFSASQFFAGIYHGSFQVKSDILRCRKIHIFMLVSDEFAFPGPFTLQVGRRLYALADMHLEINIVQLIWLLKAKESLKWFLVSISYCFNLLKFRSFFVMMLYFLLLFSFLAVNFVGAVPEDGDVPVELDVYDFKGPGIALAMYNVDEVWHVSTHLEKYGFY